MAFDKSTGDFALVEIQKPCKFPNTRFGSCPFESQLMEAL